MGQNIGSGTAKGLVEYLDSLVEKGRAPAGAITPLKTAFTKILKTVDGEKWGEVDIREIDLNDYNQRFANLTMGVYKDDSLRIYAARMQKVVTWYKTFLSKPGWAPTFKPSNGQRSSTPKLKSLSKNINNNVTANKEDTTDQDSSSVKTETILPSTTNSDLIAYPFPLSTGKLVTLYLPVKLNQSDADRLSGFLKTLVVDKSE